MSARDLIADAVLDAAKEMGAVAPFTGRAYELRISGSILSALTTAGYRLVGPDDAKLIQTALEHASFALDGIVALDDEDMGKDGSSATAQHTKRTVDRALKALRSLHGGEDGR